MQIERIPYIIKLPNLSKGKKERKPGEKKEKKERRSTRKKKERKVNQHEQRVPFNTSRDFREENFKGAKLMGGL